MGHKSDAARNIALAPAGGFIGIIPAAIISGLVLAVAGGFYVWRKTSAPPMMPRRNVTASATPAAPPAVLPSASVSGVTAQLSLALSLNIPPDPPPHHPAAARSKAFGPAKLTGLKTPATAPVQDIRIEHATDAVDPALSAAWKAYRDGNFDTASRQYSEVLRRDIQHRNAPNRDALLGMAAMAQQQSQNAIAAQYYSQILAIDPRDPDAQAGMVSLSGESGNADEESRLKLLLAQSPKAAALHFALGNYYAQQSRWGDAEQAYFSACTLESDNAQFDYNLAVSLDHLGQSKLAAHHYRHALTLDRPDNASFDHAQTQLRLDELTH